MSDTPYISGFEFNNTPEQARELVAQALESGDYVQGYGYLELQVDGGCTNCCLGVACREFIKHENDVHAIPAELFHDGTTSFDGERSKLPYYIQGWLGFNDSSGSYDGGCLTEDNDGDLTPNPVKRSEDHAREAWLYSGDKTFTGIANLFRNPPKGLLE